MHLDCETLRAACEARWPTRPAAGLADALGVGRHTAMAWVRGRNRPPADVLQRLANYLIAERHVFVSYANELSFRAQEHDRETHADRPRRIFEVAQLDPRSVPRLADVRAQNNSSRGREALHARRSAE